MTQEQIQSIKNIINYMEKDEHKDWEENGKPTNHIYTDIQELKYLII